jgi:methylamine dehydrogenase accessory protein MauD
VVDALIVSNLVLWVAVLALSALVLALVRQIGVLNERVAPAGALLVGGPKVGERAPELVLVDWSGAPLRVGGATPGRRTLLFFASPRCPVCKALLPVLESLRASEGQRLDVVVASDGPRVEHEEFVQRHRHERFGYVRGSCARRGS